MKLTPKQERFVQGVVSGLSQREAYKQAYNCEKMKNTTIDVNAAKLFKNTKVILRYDELMDEHQKKSLWTREKAVEELLWMKDQSKNDIVDAGLRQSNSNAFLNAIKELNLLENLYLLSNDKFQLEKEKMKKEIELLHERINQLKDVAEGTSDLVDEWVKAVMDDE